MEEGVGTLSWVATNNFLQISGARIFFVVYQPFLMSQEAARIFPPLTFACRNFFFCFAPLHHFYKADGSWCSGSHQCPHGVFLPRQTISSFVAGIFPTTKYPKQTRLAFDRAQVLEWVLRNNCNFYLVFFLHFWTILTIRWYARSLKLWNEVPSNKFQTSLLQK